MLARLDPRMKIATLLLLSGAAVFIGNAYKLSLLCALSLLLVLLSSIPLRMLWRRGRAFLGLIISVCVLQCLFTRTGTLVFWVITSDGILAAASVALRLCTLFLLGLFLTTSTLSDLLRALLTMKMPYEVSFMVMVSFRFLPFLREEARDVLAAMQLRGARVQGATLRDRLKVYRLAMLPIAAGAIHRAERLSVAMEARAFRAFPQRTNLRKLHATRWDGIFLSVIFILFLAIVCL